LPHEIRILSKLGVLAPIGGTAVKHQHKRFFFADILKCHADGKWLNQAETAISAFWARKNHPVTNPRELPKSKSPASPVLAAA
jgi:hypothetical protein